MSNEHQKELPRRGEFVGRVISHSDFGTRSKCISVELTGTAARVFARTKAGQFVQFSCRNLDETRSPVPLLRRPFSIGGIRSDEPKSNGPDRPNGDERLSFDVIYQLLGPGTRWLEQRRPNETINLLGPLGNGFSLPQQRQNRIILIGGGVGLPPMFFLADQLFRSGYKDTTAFAGIQTAAHFEPEIITRNFDECDYPCEISTDDGSYGFRGNAVEALEEFLGKNPDWQQAQLYACGPGVMLKAVAALAQRRGMPCQVCMEAYMSCGIGICQSCAVRVRDKNSAEQAANDKSQCNADDKPQYKLVCTNGPVFDSREIMWDE
jgi:dihydroorotate dehydrogenase electron transfer subunit